MKYDNNIQSSQVHSQQQEDDIYSTLNTRIIYLRRLYFMISIQLLFTCLAVYLGYTYIQIVDSVVKLPIIYVFSFIITMSCLIFSFCARLKVQEYPTNYGIYVIFTLSFALSMTYIIAIRQVDYGFMALIGFTTQVISLLLYVLMNKTELTFQGASVFIFSTLFINLQVFSIFTLINFYHIILVGVLQVLWGFYLVYDTQSSVSTPNQFEPQLTFTDDPTSGAVCIYMDVFVLLLRMSDLLREAIIKH